MPKVRRVLFLLAARQPAQWSSLVQHCSSTYPTVQYSTVPYRTAVPFSRPEKKMSGGLQDDAQKILPTKKTRKEELERLGNICTREQQQQQQHQHTQAHDGKRTFSSFVQTVPVRGGIDLRIARLKVQSVCRQKTKGVVRETALVIVIIMSPWPCQDPLRIAPAAVARVPLQQRPPFHALQPAVCGYQCASQYIGR